MAVGSSLGQTFEDPFDFIVKTAQMNAVPSDSEAGSKPEPVISSPVKTTENAKAALSAAYDLLVPESLKPEAPEETQRKLKAFENAKPGDKVPEMENPALKMIAGATDVAAMGIPVPGMGAAKLAMAAGPAVKGALSKGTFESLEAEMKALMKDVATTNKFKDMAPKDWYEGDKIDIKAEWDAFNKKYDATKAAKAAGDTAGIFGVAKSYVQSMKDKIAAFEQKLDAKIKVGLKNKYMEHLEPIDWQSVKSPLMGKQYETEENETVKRARELGFNVDFPLFKGGHSSPNKFESVPDPAKKNFERGIFYSDKYEIADSYASDTGQVGTYVARAPNAMVVDWKKATGYRNYDPDIMTPLIEAAHAKKADMLIVKNLHDVGGKQDQYVILNPSVVRRPDAAFDPDKLHLNHLLAGIGGMGVVAHEGLKQDKE